MAHALKFHTIVSGKTLVLPDLSAFEGKRVEVIVVEDDPGDARTKRVLGSLRGQVQVSDDFDAPLPDDVQKLFDGE